MHLQQSHHDRKIFVHSSTPHAKTRRYKSCCVRQRNRPAATHADAGNTQPSTAAVGVNRVTSRVQNTHSSFFLEPGAGFLNDNERQTKCTRRQRRTEEAGASRVRKDQLDALPALAIAFPEVGYFLQLDHHRRQRHYSAACSCLCYGVLHALTRYIKRDAGMRG